MQPSQYEIQREVEALRDLRRRSTTPGALTLDPDLPNPGGSPTSPTAIWSGSGASPTDSHSVSLPHTANPDEPAIPADDPFHLFWVPASVHPEIAPAEFRAFLKEHAHSDPSASATLGRSSSMSSSGLGRKKSMLSRQYKPSENDGVEEERIVPLRRNRSSKQGPQLTINDLQRLEELAEEASASDDPSKLRNILRRSLSLNVSPTALETMDDIPEMGDEADAPIIVPPPGQILRRAARTKIRKPGLPGDGGGHRFGASRRGGAGPGPSARSSTTMEKRTSSDRSSSDHGDSAENYQPKRSRTFSDDSLSRSRPDSYSGIFDSYVRDDDDDIVDVAPILVSGSPPELHEELPLTRPQSPPQQIPQQPVVQPELLEALGPVLHAPQPQRLLVPQVPPEPTSPSRTPSPPPSEPTPVLEPERIPAPAPTISPPAFLNQPPPSPPTSKKDKKGGLFKWGGDKGGKKATHTQQKAEKEKEKEKEGFFGSIFGGGKKKDASAPEAFASTNGREAAQALLGASKSYVPSTSPAPSQHGSQAGVNVNNWSRYPIHVERAIYRLSHIKLANPRRPLYEQVLISNLMFWYLGVINKAQAPAGTDKEKAEKERLEREKAEKERLEREEREQREREQREKAEREKREASPKRGSLTKAQGGSPAGSGRRAEMPVKPTSYEMQHRVMEQEYSGGYGAPQYNGGPPQQQYAPQSDQFYYSSDQPPLSPSSSSKARLPPGAMPPLDRQSSPPPPPRTARSPPPPMIYDGGAGAGRPARSLSATAIPSPSPPPHVNGKIRKGSSAHAVVPKTNGRRPRTSEGQHQGEEEDVPLAVWQQQRRR